MLANISLLCVSCNIFDLPVTTAQQWNFSYIDTFYVVFYEESSEMWKSLKCGKLKMFIMIYVSGNNCHFLSNCRYYCHKWQNDCHKRQLLPCLSCDSN